MQGWTLTASFSEVATTVIIARVTARNMLAIDVRSDNVELVPGGKLVFEQVWQCARA